MRKTPTPQTDHLPTNSADDNQDSVALTLFTDHETTKLLCLQPGTLAQWRVGRRVLYDLADLRAFVAGGRVETSGVA